MCFKNWACDRYLINGENIFISHIGNKKSIANWLKEELCWRPAFDFHIFLGFVWILIVLNEPASWTMFLNWVYFAEEKAVLTCGSAYLLFTEHCVPIRAMVRTRSLVVKLWWFRVKVEQGCTGEFFIVNGVKHRLTLSI